MAGADRSMTQPRRHAAKERDRHFRRSPTHLRAVRSYNRAEVTLEDSWEAPSRRTSLPLRAYKQQSARPGGPTATRSQLIHHRTPIAAAGPRPPIRADAPPVSHIGCSHIFRHHGGYTDNSPQTAPP
jgi:hypothetical protein